MNSAAMRRSNFAIGLALLTACAGHTDTRPSLEVALDQCAVRSEEWVAMLSAPDNRDQLLSLSYRGVVTSSYLGTTGARREACFSAADDRVSARDGDLMVCRYPFGYKAYCGVPQVFFKRATDSWSVLTQQEAACVEE